MVKEAFIFNAAEPNYKLNTKFDKEVETYADDIKVKPMDSDQRRVNSSKIKTI